jgi:hypothetical protein
MAFDPDEAFEFMRCMYRSGLLDRVSAIQGEAMADVMAEAGLNMGDMANNLDLAGEQTIARIDRMLGTIGPAFRYLANERLMRAIAHVLDVPMVRRQLLKNMKKSMLASLTTEAAA